MPFTKNAETDLYIAPTGVKYVLSRPPNRFVMSEEGSGIPPIAYVTQRGPYQHGESLRDFFLQPRTIQMIVRHNYCDREDYWNGRNELLSVLVPTNSVSELQEGTLRKIMPGGAVRDLACVISEGPKFVARDPSQWDELSYTETLRFVANNPIYFDPAQKTFSIVDTSVATFPLSFPLAFVAVGTTQTLHYHGNWPEYPKIIVTGPLGGFSITNVTTGRKITLDYVISAGQTVTFDLTYGSKSVTLDDGTNLIGYITTDSDLTLFQLIPGDNIIFVVGNEDGPITPHTTIQLLYYNRYIGI